MNKQTKYIGKNPDPKLILLEGSLSFCAVVPIFIYSFRGAPEFQGMYHGFYILFTFYTFPKWILLLLVREKHRKTLYRFLLTKIKDVVINNKDKNSETRQTDKK